MLAALRPELVPVHTEVYDGPLELLLYLVRRDGLDVRDIAVARIADEYLRYLDMMAELDIDLAGEFIVMAATLCALKSREILPRSQQVAQDDEEEVDPKEDLIRRLQEYQRYKEGAEKLESRPLLGRDVFTRPQAPLRADEKPVDPTVDAFGLLEIFYAVMQKKAVEPPSHEVRLEEYSMAERVQWVLERLDEWGGGSLTELMALIGSRAQRILTFLAILEMARLQMVGVEQVGHLEDVKLIRKVSAAEVDLSVLPDEAVS